MPTVVESLRAPTYFLMLVPPPAILRNPEGIPVHLIDLQKKDAASVLNCEFASPSHEF